MGKIAIEISDGDWIEKEHIFSTGDYRIIQTGNIGIGEYLDKTNNAKYLNQRSFENLKANQIFPNDILVSRLAEPAGRTIILPDINEKMVTAVDVMIIRPNPKQFNSVFFMTNMNREATLKIISKSVSGTSHKRISRKNLEKTPILAPTIEEQTRIGTFFQEFDNLIAIHQRK